MTLDDNGAPNGAGRLLDEWRNAAYNCFSSGHKFCREVCPVLQVTHDETHSPTAFHANVVAMDRGLLGIERPEITAAISARRVAQAKQLDVDLLVSACVWSERPLSEQGAERSLEVCDLMELVAHAAGLQPRAGLDVAAGAS